MKIAILFTGGTIGSAVRADGQISSCEEAKYLLLDLYEKTYGNDVAFETFEPYRILSENLNAQHLNLLIQSVSGLVSRKDLAGILITHGTDSLAYSAAMLQYLFGGCGLPIVLVSSDYVLTDARANGLTNFKHAVSFLLGGCGKGVFVSYCNQGGRPEIHRGNRLQDVITYSADVSSILGSSYGWFEGKEFVRNPLYQVHPGDTVSMGDMLQNPVLNPLYQAHSDNAVSMNGLLQNPVLRTSKETPATSQYRAAFSDSSFPLISASHSILTLRAMPGISYPAITGEETAVLYEGYHSGTIPVDEPLKQFAAAAQAHRVPIYVTGLTDGVSHYETVQMYRELGIEPLVNRSFISQYCKLWLAASMGLDTEQIMSSSVAEDWVVFQ